MRRHNILSSSHDTVVPQGAVAPSTDYEEGLRRSQRAAVRTQYSRVGGHDSKANEMDLASLYDLVALEAAEGPRTYREVRPPESETWWGDILAGM